MWFVQRAYRDVVREWAWSDRTRSAVGSRKSRWLVVTRDTALATAKWLVDRDQLPRWVYINHSSASASKGNHWAISVVSTGVDPPWTQAPYYIVDQRGERRLLPYRAWRLRKHMRTQRERAASLRMKGAD